ncbi:MAG: hypothetical protein JWL76_1872 [Thermoleophilia bacterium]|nr:hypothetical protein [Thermoleophilia bacterium]
MRVVEAPVATNPASEPAGWSPGAITPSISTRGPGLLRGGLDAWCGVPERSAGVPLTSVQVATLAPFLAQAMQLPDDVVRSDLDRVRVQVGGLAHDAGNMATTIGLNIYVSDAERATRMLSWEGRRWLVHELGHTMQWRRSASPAATDAQRDRTFLNEYVGAFAAHDGRIGAGGFAEAAREWRRRRDSGTPVGSVGNLLHDTHPMEREAERVAVAFVTAHP